MKIGHHTFKKLLLLTAILCSAVIRIDKALAAVPSYWDYRVGISEEEITAVRQGVNRLEKENGVYLIRNYNDPVDIGININSFAPEKIFFNYKIDYVSDGQQLIGTEEKNGFVTTKDEYIHSYDGPLMSLGGVYLNPNAKYTKYTITINDTKIDTNGVSVKGDNVLLNEEFVFSFSDYDSSKSPSIAIQAVRQNGSEINPTVSHEYILDRYGDYEIDIIGTDLPEGSTYKRWNSATTKTEVYTSQELLNGVTLKYTAGQDVRRDNFSSGIFSQHLMPKYYDNGVGYLASVSFTSPESQNFSFNVSYYQTGKLIGASYDTGAIHESLSHKVYNPDTNPIKIQIYGVNYQSDKQYDVSLKILNGEALISNKKYNIIGDMLNSGYTIIINDIQLGKTIADIINSENVSGYFSFAITIEEDTEVATAYCETASSIESKLFTMNGLPVSSYAIGRASAGYAYVSRDALDVEQNTYLYFKTNEDANSNYNYYVFYSDAEEETGFPWNLANAEIVKQGEATGPIEMGIQVNNNKGYNVPGYVVVIEKDGMVDSMGFKAIIPIDTSNYKKSTARIYPYLEKENGKIQYSNSYNNVLAYNIKLFSDGLEKDKEYRAIVEELNDNVYHNELTATGEELNDGNLVFSLSTDHVINSTYGREIRIAVFDGDELIDERLFSLYWTDYPIDDDADYAGIDDVKIIREIRSAQPEQQESHFSVTMAGDDAFEEEFDVFLSVDGYENLSNTCGGICGVVGKLEYDTSKIELVSAEALEEFEITQGEKIVLNRPTGVAAGTAIMKLHFRSVAMSANTSTTINFTNIVGSDGTNNISANDASISVRKTLSFYSLAGRLFASTGEQFNGNVQSYSSDFMIMKFDVDPDTFNNDGYLTAVFDGLGFTANTPYIYSLKSFSNGSDDKETLFSGEVTADEILKGSLKFKLTNPSNSSDTMYELVVKKGDNTIFTSSINIVLNNEPHFSEAVKYGYSDSDFIGSHYILPTNSSSSVIIKASNIDTSKNYRISTNNSEYKSCTTVPNGTGVITSCDGPVQGQAIPDITVSGENLSSGYSVPIPMPVNTSTIRTLGIKIYEEGVETSIESITVSQRFVEDSDIIVSAETLVLDDYILSNIPLGTIASSVQSSIIVNNAYSISMISDAGSELAQNDKIGTGSKIRINNIYGQTVLEYTARIKGDLNGDGNITITDLVKAKRHLALIAPVEGIYAEAADITRSGFIGITDIVKICRHIAGLEVISQ